MTEITKETVFYRITRNNVGFGRRPYDLQIITYDRHVSNKGGLWVGAFRTREEAQARVEPGWVKITTWKEAGALWDHFVKADRQAARKERDRVLEAREGHAPVRLPDPGGPVVLWFPIDLVEQLKALEADVDDVVRGEYRVVKA